MSTPVVINIRQKGALVPTLDGEAPAPAIVPVPLDDITAVTRLTPTQKGWNGQVQLTHGDLVPTVDVDDVLRQMREGWARTGRRRR